MSSTLLHLAKPDAEAQIATAAPRDAAPSADDKNPFLAALGERVRNLRARRGGFSC